jgi:Tfp pilus assembly protein PilO
MMLQAMPPIPPIPFDPNRIAGPFLVMIVIAALAATAIVLLPIMRAFGRRLEGKASGDPALRDEVDQLHARLSEVDTLQARVAELEERVDFTERLLAQAHEPSGRVLKGESQ